MFYWKKRKITIKPTTGINWITLARYLDNGYKYNSTTYETSTEKFYLNITTDGQIPTSSNLNHNGTGYSATVINTGGNEYNIIC